MDGIFDKHLVSPTLFVFFVFSDTAVSIRTVNWENGEVSLEEYLNAAQMELLMSIGFWEVDQLLLRGLYSFTPRRRE